MADGKQYMFQDRAVVFLDVLGFQQKLTEFEKEAIQYKEENNSEYYFSQSVNEFVNTFKEAVSFLDANNYNYYLFSDNICITIDYIQNHNLLVEIFVTINELFLRFAAKGYFLRGGLDVGKFIDEKSIAVGMPLANAYKLETLVAVYPRVVISNDYKKLLDAFEENQSLSEKSISLKKYLLKTHCEVNYLNTFFYLIDRGDKIDILTSLRKAIIYNLEASAKAEHIAIKYEWLLSQFNSFIDEYTTTLRFLETEIPTDEETETIQLLKIQGYAN